MDLKSRSTVEEKNNLNLPDEEINFNDLNKDLTELNKTVLNIKKRHVRWIKSSSNKKNSDVKVIRLDVDKNTANMMK